MRFTRGARAWKGATKTEERERWLADLPVKVTVSREGNFEVDLVLPLDLTEAARQREEYLREIFEDDVGAEVPPAGTERNTRTPSPTSVQVSATYCLER